MAAADAAHVVEIPTTTDKEQETRPVLTISAMQHHPLMEISRSPGHLLLLKLWQRDETILNRRIILRETRLDSIKLDLFHLSCSFFIFHALFLTALFTSTSTSSSSGNCRKWWAPAAVSLSTSLVFVGLVQQKLWRFWKVHRQLQRERSDSRAVIRCVQELRMKGKSCDLSKEPLVTGKRMKSSSVEIKWKPLTWCHHNLTTLCLLSFTALLFPASKLLLCGL